MRHCDECGSACPPAGIHGVTVPVCAEHGPRWILVRTGAAADVIVQRDGRALLVRRAIEPFAGHWATVGGFVNPREHPADTARREALEELGLDVELIGVLGVYVQPYHGEEWLVTTVYVGEASGEPEPDPGEVAECAWFAPDAIPEVMAWDHRRRVETWARWRAAGHRLTPP